MNVLQVLFNLHIEPPRGRFSLNVYSFIDTKLIRNIVLVSGIQ